jgi:DNA primase
MLSPALRYLRSDPEHAESAGLLRRRNGQAWEFFAGRITFVERNRAGRVIHMAGRAVSSKARVKYLFLPDLRKPVYGLAWLNPSHPVFVVEGIIELPYRICVTCENLFRTRITRMVVSLLGVGSQLW